MTTKEELHELVDWLPEGIWEKAHKTLLRELKNADPVAYSLFTAPVDDEEETEEERAAIDEMLEDIRAGRAKLIPHEEVVRRLLESP